MFKINFLLTILLLSALAIDAQTYKNSELPDAMTFLDGSKVKTKADWVRRKKEIKNLWCDYFIGHFPNKVPELLSVEVVKTDKKEDGSTTRKRIVLTFDTPNKKSFEIQVWEPKDMDNTARPLFLTQPKDYQIQWAEEAVKRGYIACLYPGLDAHHNEKAHTKHMFDYFDMTFGRGTLTRDDFPEILHHQFDFKAWKSKQRRKDLKFSKNKALEEKINWMLGEKPDNITGEGKYHLKKEEELGVPAWSRDRWNPDKKPTGGISRLWEWHHVIPKLGLYNNKEAKYLTTTMMSYK